MTTAFKPKGDIAEWRLVYDFLCTLDIDDVLTYEQLGEILDRPFSSNKSVIYRAMKELEVSNRRTLINIPTVGYRVAKPGEHADRAKEHHRRSRRQMTKALSKAHSADRAGMTDEERKKVDNIELQLSRQLQMIKRLEARQQLTEVKVEQTMADTERHSAALELLLADYEERMAAQAA